jgi:hypothetical protein
VKVVVNQSNYVPWKGYFDLIHDADLFVFYDDLQFTKNDWRNRNKLKTAAGVTWLTIPVGKDIDRLICEVALPGGDWAAQHWRRIEESYRAMPHFAAYAPAIREIFLGRGWTRLADLNQCLIKHIAVEVLGMSTRFGDSRDYSLEGRKQDRLMSLLRAVGATTYISGPSAKAYLDESRMNQEGIAVIWKDYSGYPEYPQAYPPFEHAVSILDLIFNTGPAASHYIWGWRATTRLQS